MSGRRDKYRFVRTISKVSPKGTTGVDSQATAYAGRKSFKWLREDATVPSLISGASSKSELGTAVTNSAFAAALPRPGISAGVRENKRAAVKAGASYVRNKKNQLCRISTSTANRADTRVETSRGPQRAENLVRKSQHSLVRRGSLVSAVARTVARMKDIAPQGASRLCLAPRLASLREPSQLSAHSTRTRKWVSRTEQLQWPRKGFGKTWQAGKPVSKAAPATRAHPWKGRLPSSAQPVHWKASQSKQKAPAKLVRMSGSLYKVVRGARGGSLKRQAPVNLSVKAPAKQAYKRWGLSLRRTEAAASPKNKQEALTRMKQGVLARPLQPAGLLAVKSKQTAHPPPANGVIARIRGRTMLTNTPCIEYCRTGTCAEKEKGTCLKIHDPKKVAICSFWLNSTCDEANCPFQHVVQKDLMPLCSHFIKGSCSTSSCPYLHVMHDPGTPVCKAFLKGYCPKGAACSHRHLTTRMLRELSRSATSSALRKESRGLKRRSVQLPCGDPIKRAAVSSGAVGGEIGAGDESAAIRPAFLR